MRHKNCASEIGFFLTDDNDPFPVKSVKAIYELYKQAINNAIV